MDNSYILVTGASSGIGQSIAINLSSDYNIILNGRNGERLTKTKGLCNQNKNQLIWEFDLNKVQQLETELTSFVTSNQIQVSAFIHCAGFLQMFPLKMVNLETISKTFNTNVFSATIISKCLKNRKVNSSLKNIVFISSNISNMGAKAMSVYGASKGALDSLMRCLAVELAPEVRVNSVLPGAIQTEMTSTIDEDVIKRMSATYPLGPGRPSDIFDIVNFIISEKARWITGQQFIVDGGRTINISG